MKNTLYLLFLITLLQGCLFPTEKGKGTIDLRSQRDGGPNDLSDNSSPSTFSSITLNNDQITIDGSDLNGITEVKLEGSGLNDVLSIVSQTATQIVLSYASNLVLPLGSLVDIVITDAGAASSTTVTFQLPNDSVGTVQIVDDAVTTAKITDGAITAAKLNDMGAANGDVLVYNTGSTSWVPTPLSGLNYIGSWNANTNAPSLSDGGATTSPSAGDYYVTSVTGATSIDGESTWIAGDWIIYNGSDWQRINNAGTVLSFNGRTGAIVSATNDYTWAQINMGTSSIDDIADIDTSTVSPNDGEVLKWNNATGKWEPAADETAGAGSVGSSEIADGSIASADLSSDSVTSAKIADGSIVNADINASAAIDYSKLSIADNDLSIAKTNGLQTNLDDLSSDIASNAAAITTKEPTITAAATTTYYRGDKTFVTLNTAVVPESGSLYFSEARVLGTQLAGYSTGSSLALANGDSLIVALGKLEAQITSVDSSADGALQKDGSNSMTGDLDLGTNDITNAAAGTFSGTVSASNFIGSGAGLTGLVADPSDDSVTSSKIADGSILTADLSDDAITSAKIANVSVSKITSGAGAYLTYMPNNVECSDGEVLAWSVSNRWECASAGAAGTVTSITGGAGLTDGPFTTTGTININVDNTTIEVSSDTLIVKDNAITTAKVLDDAITTAKILDGEILSADLTNDSITSAKIVNDTITNADINTSAAIEYSKLNIADSDLTIAKTSGLQTLLDDLSSDVASLDSSNDGLYSLDGSKALTGTMQLNDNWISNDGGAEGIRIDDSGNVGIGTANPNYLLEIKSPGLAQSPLLIRSSADGDILAFFNEDASANGNLYLRNNNNNSTIKLAGSGSTYFTGGNFGIGTTTPSASAILDVSSDSKGFLPPRMTTSQRDAIGSPVAGLQIYNTTNSTIDYYNGSSWLPLNGNAKYIKLGMSGTQSIDVGDIIAFNTIESNNGFSSTGNGIDLKAGVTYRLEAALNIVNATGLKYVGYRLHNGSISFGQVAYTQASDGISYGFKAKILEFYTPLTDETITVRVHDDHIGTGTVHYAWNTHFIATELIGAGSGDASSDNMGNHTATTNIKLGANYLSGDGDNEGLQIDSDGHATFSNDVTFDGNVDFSSATIVSDSINVNALDFASTDGINIPQLASDPGSPTTGQQYFNTTSNTLKVYNGTSWIEVGSTQSIGGSMLSGWPDALICNGASGTMVLWFRYQTSSVTRYQYVHSDTYYVSLNTADKTALSNGGHTGWYDDCKSKSLSTLYSENLAKNFVGSSGISTQDSDGDTAVHLEKVSDEDKIRFDTAGSERMIIDASGDVGIGTTSPGAELDVNGAIIAEGAMGIFSKTGLHLQNKGASVMDVGAWRSGVSAAEISFSTDSGLDAAPLERMRIDKNGNVGIGTTNPDSGLHLASTGQTELTVSGGGSGYHNGAVVLKATQAATRAGGIYMHNSVDSTEWFAGKPYNAPDRYVISRKSAVATHDPDTATSSRALMTVNSSGNVGIGTTSPGDKLTVLNGNIIVREDDDGNDAVRLTAGNISGSIGLNNAGITTVQIAGGTNVDSYFNTGGNVGIGTTSPDIIFHIDAGADTNVQGTKITAQRPVIQLEETDANANENWQIENKSGKLSFGTNNDVFGSVSDKVIIDQAGNLGIGTSTPEAPLQIKGNVSFGDSDTTGSILKLYGTTASSYATLQTTNGNLHLDAGVAGPGSGLYLNHYNGSNVFIGASSHKNNLTVYGTATTCSIGVGTSGTSCSSDSRLKDNITPIEDSLEKLIDINGVEFDWNENTAQAGQKAIGVIAQDVETVFPELVSKSEQTGYKMVDYAGLVSPIIEAIKELHQRFLGLFKNDEEQSRTIASLVKENREMKEKNRKQDKKIERITKKNKRLKSRLSAIEQALCQINSEGEFCH